MSNTWFRMYSEVLNDPKVQKLPENLFKIWVNTLCVACNNNGTLQSLEDVSFALRLPFHETKSAFLELEKSGLLVTDGETFQFKTWKKRQYKSDVSTKRVKKFRDNQRNVSETPPEQIQNRTDITTLKEGDSDFTKILDAGLRANPNLAAKDSSIVRAWISAGVTPEDAIPQIERLGPKATSWKYFTHAVMDAHASRTTPLPKGNPNANTGGNYPKGLSKSEQARAALLESAIELGYAGKRS